MKTIKVTDKVIGTYYAFQSDKSDKPFKNPMTVNRLIKLLPTDVVVDIGAYVGEYSMWAALQGVKRVISYEATPNTFKLLQKNKLDKMTVINKAVVGDSSKSVDLFISKGIGVTNSIAKSSAKAGKIKVNAINYDKAVKSATVVKIDVEGAEYQYNLIKTNLRAIILEFHPIVNMNWQKEARRIMRDLRVHGYKSLAVPKFENGWDMAGCWVKK